MCVVKFEFIPPSTGLDRMAGTGAFLFYGDENDEPGDFEDRNLWTLTDWQADQKVRAVYQIVPEGQSRFAPKVYGELTFKVWTFRSAYYHLVNVVLVVFVTVSLACTPRFKSPPPSTR